MKNIEFLTDLIELCKKHNMMAMTSQDNEKLASSTKHLDGSFFFFTTGEKKLYLQGGIKYSFDSSVTIKMQKNRNTNKII